MDEKVNFASEEMLIATCAMVLRNSPGRSIDDIAETDIGRDRFIKGHKYMVLEDKILELFRSIRRLYAVIQRNPDNERYVKQYWDKDAEIERLYQELKTLSDAVSLSAILCPGIYYADHLNKQWR